VRSAASPRCRALISDILCHGDGALPDDLSPAQTERLEEFEQRGLIRIGAGRIRLDPDALPYARTIAAIFDPLMVHKIGGFSAPV